MASDKIFTSQPNNAVALFTLSDLRLSLSIGLTEEERSALQPIRFDVKITYVTPPQACQTDEIDDTICYHTMVNNIEAFCSKRVYKLLESLCYELFQHLKHTIKEDVKLWIRVEKCEPPVNNVSHVSFEYGE